MEINKEVRKKQLQSLNEYIGSSKDKVQSILNCLGWSVEKLLEKDERIDCPIDAGHRIDRKTADRHLEKCEIKSQGYDLNERFLTEPLIAASDQTLVLDRQKKIEIFTRASSASPYFRQAWNGSDPDPKTSDRFFSTFSPDERLALYNYCRENSVGPKPPDEYIVPQDMNTDENNKVFSLNELRAFERDAKRRQVKYKSVHTDRKTYTEVMKEVIEKQMELYDEWTNRRNQDNTNDDNDGGEEVEQTQTDLVELEERKSHRPPNDYYSNGEQIKQRTGSERRCESPGKYSNASSNRSGRRRREIDKTDWHHSSQSHSSRSHSHSRHSSLESHFRSGAGAGASNNNIGKARIHYKKKKKEEEEEEEEPRYERYYDYKCKDYNDKERKKYSDDRYNNMRERQHDEDYHRREGGKRVQKIKSRIEVKGGERRPIRCRSDYDYERNRSKDR